MMYSRDDHENMMYSHDDHEKSELSTSCHRDCFKNSRDGDTKLIFCANYGLKFINEVLIHLFSSCRASCHLFGRNELMMLTTRKLLLMLGAKMIYVHAGC